MAFPNYSKRCGTDFPTLVQYRWIGTWIVDDGSGCTQHTVRRKLADGSLRIRPLPGLGFVPGV